MLSMTGMPAWVAVLCALTFAGARAATIGVPGHQPTIQAGIDAASVGDTVLVAPGTYTGDNNKNLDFGGIDLVLRSESGAAYTIIDCEDAGRGLLFQSEETRAARVEGFTIRNGSISEEARTEGGGILIDNGSSPTITDCVIESCTTYWSGGGVSVRGGGPGRWTSPLLERCEIRGNVSTMWQGGGVVVGGHEAAPELVDCVISDNRTEYRGGGGIFVGGAAARFTNCVIRGNEAQDMGMGGGAMDTQGLSHWESCRFVQNRALGGGGYYLRGGKENDPLTFNDCVFVANEGHGRSFGGGAIYLDHGSMEFTGCVFLRNDGNRVGGAVRASEDSQFPYMMLRFWNCIFEDNVAVDGTIYGYSNPSDNRELTFEMTNCRIARNRGGGIRATAVVSLDHVTISENTGGPGVRVSRWDGGLSIQNSILWNPTETEIELVDDAEAVVEYTDVRGGYPGMGNLDADPLLRSKGPVNDFLWPGSPCIDAGIGDDDGADWCDIHPVYCRYNGAAPDMGAYGGPGNLGWLF